GETQPSVHAVVLALEDELRPIPHTSEREPAVGPDHHRHPRAADRHPHPDRARIRHPRTHYDPPRHDPRAVVTSDRLAVTGSRSHLAESAVDTVCSMVMNHRPRRDIADFQASSRRAPSASSLRIRVRGSFHVLQMQTRTRCRIHLSRSRRTLGASVSRKSLIQPLRYRLSIASRSSRLMLTFRRVSPRTRAWSRSMLWVAFRSFVRPWNG